MSEGAESRRFLRSRRHGVLSTLSRRHDGYPFGSVVPFVLNHEARPVIFISRLAEHTRNIEADSRVSLLVSDAGDDVQAGARLTLVGEAARIRGDVEALRTRYLNYHPAAGQLMALGDFAFYVITPRALRFIGGFGHIHWVSAPAYAPPTNDLAEQEAVIVEHMNAGHPHNLRDYCRHYHGRPAQEARMTGIDCDGFDVRADGELLRFEFEQPVADATSAREALVAMAGKARAA
jgi:heme iron utilization protein